MSNRLIVGKSIGRHSENVCVSPFARAVPHDAAVGRGILHLDRIRPKVCMLRNCQLKLPGNCLEAANKGRQKAAFCQPPG